MSKAARALTRIVSIVAALGVATATAGMVMQERTDLQGRSHAEMVERATIAAAAVSIFSAPDADRLANTAGQRPLRLAVRRGRWGVAVPYLRDLKRVRSHLLTVALYDGKGVLRVRVPGDRTLMGKKFAKQEYFSAVRRTRLVHTSKLYVMAGKPQRIVFAYSIAMFAGSRLIGVLVATLPVTALDGLVTRVTPPGSTLRLYNPSAELIEPSSEVQVQAVPADDAVRRALTGTADVRRVAPTDEATVPVPILGWALKVTQPTSVIDKKTSDATLHMSLLAGIATALAVIAALAARWRFGERAPEPPAEAGG